MTDALVELCLSALCARLVCEAIFETTEQWRMVHANHGAGWAWVVALAFLAFMVPLFLLVQSTGCFDGFELCALGDQSDGTRSQVD